MNIFEEKRVFVAGSTGMVGSAICRLLRSKFFNKDINLLIPNRKTLDLTNTRDVNEWFSENKPNIVIMAAAKVGGILANSQYPVEFLIENLKIQNNIIEAAYKFGVNRFLFLGSSCIYPKLAKQPIKEDYLLTDSLEDTNQWYAIAKIAGIKLCEAYRKQYNLDAISLMPTNLYGPGDNYHINNSHVMAALIRKFYEAKRDDLDSVVCWGSGRTLREFLYVDDLAEACLYCLNKWFPGNINAPTDNNGKPLFWLNVGSNYEISISDLAFKIAKILKYEGEIIWDRSKPDGTPRKKLDSSKINSLGWEPKIDIDIGINKTLNFFIEEYSNKTNN